MEIALSTCVPFWCDDACGVAIEQPTVALVMVSVRPLLFGLTIFAHSGRATEFGFVCFHTLSAPVKRCCCRMQFAAHCNRIDSM